MRQVDQSVGGPCDRERGEGVPGFPGRRKCRDDEEADCQCDDEAGARYVRAGHRETDIDAGSEGEHERRALRQP